MILSYSLELSNTHMKTTQTQPKPVDFTLGKIMFFHTSSQTKALVPVPMSVFGLRSERQLVIVIWLLHIIPNT